MGFCDYVLLARESYQRASLFFSFFFRLFVQLFYWVEIVGDFQLIKGLLCFL